MQGDEDKIVPPNQVGSSLTPRHHVEIGAPYFEWNVGCQMIMSDPSALLSAATPVI